MEMLAVIGGLMMMMLTSLVLQHSTLRKVKVAVK